MRPSRAPLAVILASATLTIMAGSVIAPVLNTMREGLGAAPSSIGIIITTHGLFMALASPLMGSLIDRVGARGPYVVSLFAYGLAGGSGLFIGSFWVLLVSRAFLGVALAGVFTAINVLILDMYEGPERNKYMGWRGTAQSLGGVLWPVLGGALGALSWHMPFGVYTLAIPIGVAAAAMIPPTPPHLAKTPGAEDHHSVWKIFVGNGVLWLIYGLIFTGSVLLYAVVIFMPQLLETFGITSTLKIGLFITAMTASAGAVSFIYGHIRSRFAYRWIVLMSVTLWTAAFGSLSLAGTGAAVIISVALFGVSQGLVMPTVMVWIGDAVPPSYRGRFSSYLGTFGFIGQFLSPILFAPVFIIGGLKAVFTTGAAVSAVWLALVLLFIGSRRKKTIAKGGNDAAA
ncbi:MAG: MFS transporter [bacterium]|nr:MAG: MFS transporter [bacterium]